MDKSLGEERVAVNLIGPIVGVIATLIGLVIYGQIYVQLNLQTLGSGAIALLGLIPLVLVAVLILSLITLIQG